MAEFSGVLMLTWTTYGAFAVVAVVLALLPGPDVAVVMRGAVLGGQDAGMWSAAGVSASNLVQGSAAALGIGALVMGSQPVFETVRWAGIGYLCWLGVHALRSALRAGPPPAQTGSGAVSPAAGAGGWVRFGRGFLVNITNPKVLVFYLSVLPQFLVPGSTVLDALVLAYTHAVVSLVWLLVVACAVGSLRGWMSGRRVRRGLDGATAVVMFGFAGRLALEKV